MFLAPLSWNCLFVKIDFCLILFYFSTSLGRFLFYFSSNFCFFLFLFVFALLSNQKKRKKEKKRVFLSLFCSFSEIINRIGLEHTNAKGTTCGRSVAETLPNIYIHILRPSFWIALMIFP
jgi:hypothetical protein